MNNEIRLKRVEELKKEIDSLEKEIVDNSIQTPEGLATEIHKRFCHSNHTDQCGWYYENENDFKGANGTRNRYYIKAIKLLATGLKPTQILEILDIVYKY